MTEQPESNTLSGPGNRRPLSVTIIGILFLITGAIGVAYHATELKSQDRFPSELWWICLVRLLVVIGAIFLLRGSNWARWLLVIWMAYHVVLSIFHSASQAAVHMLFLVMIWYFLFRQPASAYFRRAKPNLQKSNTAPDE